MTAAEARETFLRNFALVHDRGSDEGIAFLLAVGIPPAIAGKLAERVYDLDAVKAIGELQKGSIEMNVRSTFGAIIAAGLGVNPQPSVDVQRVDQAAIMMLALVAGHFDPLGSVVLSGASPGGKAEAHGVDRHGTPIAVTAHPTCRDLCSWALGRVAAEPDPEGDVERLGSALAGLAEER